MARRTLGYHNRRGGRGSALRRTVRYIYIYQGLKKFPTQGPYLRPKPFEPLLRPRFFFLDITLRLLLELLVGLPSL